MKQLNYKWMIEFDEYIKTLSNEELFDEVVSYADEVDTASLLSRTSWMLEWAMLSFKERMGWLDNNA